MNRVRKGFSACSFAALLALTSFVAACGAQSNGTDNGGRTHWLRSCASDAECGAGICREDRCTVLCSSQVDCDFTSDAVCGAEHCEPTALPPTPEQDVTTPPTETDEGTPALLDAGSDTPEAGIWLTGSLDDGSPQELVFAEEVTAYTRDPNNRTLISLVATKTEWGSITLNLVSNPGPVSAGQYTCATGASEVSATLLTDTGILSLRSDAPPTGGCEITVVDPGEQVGAAVSGTFNAVLVSTSGSVFTITDGGFWGVLNE